MKRPVAIVLVLLFSISVLLSGAFGYSDCAAKCAYEMAKTHQHAAMRSASLAAPNCCAGVMKNTCEMGGTIEIKIPECSMAGHRTVAPDPIGIGSLPSDIETDHIRQTQSNRRSITAEIKPQIPLYLKKLSLLC